ncbi:MAG: hypothetical protein ABW189_01700 [Rickettsiales bacterium]
MGDRKKIDFLHNPTKAGVYVGSSVLESSPPLLRGQAFASNTLRFSGRAKPSIRSALAGYARSLIARSAAIAALALHQTAHAAAPAGMIPYPVLKPALNARTQDPAGDEGATLLPPSESLASPEASGDVIMPASRDFGLSPQKRTACPPSPAVEASFPKPEEMRRSNNLWRRTGSVDHAAGQYIRIDGVVRDANCMPVSGAHVTMWQRDQAGMYEARYRRIVENPLRHPEYDPNFGYSGQTDTDNLGEFSFISIMPGVQNYATPPHLNVEIRHEDFKTLTTRIYLLPNGTAPDSSASPTRNPFASSGIPPLYDWNGVAAGSAVTEEGEGFGIEFFADIALRGKTRTTRLY